MGTCLSHTSEVHFQLLFLRFNKDTLKSTYPSTKWEHCQDSLQTLTLSGQPGLQPQSAVPLSLPDRHVPRLHATFATYYLHQWLVFCSKATEPVIRLVQRANKPKRHLSSKLGPFITNDLSNWQLQRQRCLWIQTKSKKTRGEYSQSTVQNISRVLRTRKHGKKDLRT